MIQNIFALARLDVSDVFVRCLQTQEVLKYDGFSVLLLRSLLRSAFGSRVYNYKRTEKTILGLNCHAIKK